MPICLQLNRAYTPAADGPSLVRRVYLRAELRHPHYPLAHGRRYEAVIDTGAEASVFPQAVVDWFAQRACPLPRGPSGRLAFADGTIRDDIPRYAVELVLYATRFGARRPTVRLDVDQYSRGPHRFHGYALPMPDDAAHVLVGMDLLSHWRLVLDGPRGEFQLEVPEPPRRHPAPAAQHLPRHDHHPV